MTQGHTGFWALKSLHGCHYLLAFHVAYGFVDLCMSEGKRRGKSKIIVNLYILEVISLSFHEEKAFGSVLCSSVLPLGYTNRLCVCLCIYLRAYSSINCDHLTF